MRSGLESEPLSAEAGPMTVSHQATYEWIYARPKGELRQLAEQQVALGTSLFGDVLTVVGLGIEVAAFFVSSPVLTAALAVAGWK